MIEQNKHHSQWKSFRINRPFGNKKIEIKNDRWNEKGNNSDETAMHYREGNNSLVVVVAIIIIMVCPW